jgi:hypothetical protein
MADMPQDQLPFTSLLLLSLSDPVFVVGIILPVIIAGGIIWYRIRAYRRLTAITARVDQTAEQNTAQWDQAAARAERTIALLTEIRDHLARIAPATPAPGERADPSK